MTLLLLLKGTTTGAQSATVPLVQTSTFGVAATGSTAAAVSLASTSTLAVGGAQTQPASIAFASSSTFGVTPLAAGINLVGSPTLYESASDVQVVIPVPTGVSAGHLLVATVVQSSASTTATPTGWTAVAATTATSLGIAKFIRYATASEPASYTFATSATAGRVTGLMYALSGVDQATALDVASSVATTGVTTAALVVPSITTVTAGAWVDTSWAVNAASSADGVVPTSFALVNRSTGTGRRGVVAQRVQAGAGATGTVSWQETPTTTALQQVATQSAFRPVVSASTPTLNARSVGDNGTVTTLTSNVTSVRLRVSTDAAGTTGVVYSTPVTPNANGVARPQVTGLTAGVRYYYRVGLTDSNGVETWDARSTVGRLQVAPSGATSFVAYLVACCNAPDSDAMNAIAARDDGALLLHRGDFFYDDGGDTSLAGFRTSLVAKLSAPYHESVFATTQMLYGASDHDSTKQNNGNGGSSPAAIGRYNQVYDELFATPTRPAGITGHYFAKQWGRVLFLSLDSRSFATVASATDDASKTLLGATQKQWVKDQITATTAGLVVLLGDGTWVGAPVAGDDAWLGYSTERTELANFVVASGKRVAYMAGDMHALAADDGTNSSGGIPVFQSAPLNNSSSIKGGPFTAGTYPASGSATVQQYARLVFTDDGSTITVAFTGYSSSNVQRITQTTTFATAAAAVSLVQSSTFGVVPAVPATVALSQTSTLAVTPAVSHPATVALSQTSTLAVTPAVTQPATVVLAGTSSLTVASTVSHPATATFVSSSTLAVTSAGQQGAVLALVSSSTLAVVPALTHPGGVALTGTSTLAITAGVTRRASFALVQSSTLVVTPRTTILSAVVLAGLNVLGVVATTTAQVRDLKITSLTEPGTGWTATDLVVTLAATDPTTATAANEPTVSLIAGEESLQRLWSTGEPVVSATAAEPALVLVTAEPTI